MLTFASNAVIIGRGIGLETTILFVREGASVLMADISSPALDTAIAKVRSIVSSSKIKLETMRCDVSKEADVEAMVKHVDAWGKFLALHQNVERVKIRSGYQILTGTNVQAFT